MPDPQGCRPLSTVASAVTSPGCPLVVAIRRESTMKFLPGPLAAASSGSIGGVTFSHNAFGPYARTKAIPVNPNTPAQQTVRGFMADLSNLWINTLTQAQRDDWKTYAANVTVIDKLGQAINVTGMNMYVRSNVPALQAGLVRQDDAPSVFDLGSFTNPALVATASGPTLDVSFNNTDDWANEDGAAMLVYGSRPQNPTINFFKGPYQFAGRIDGDAITPPTSPTVITSPFAFDAAQKVFAKISVVRADGRLSGNFRLSVLAV